MFHTLYLLRHGQAQSARDAGLQADHARPLSDQGRAEIARLAECLHAPQSFRPDQVLVSSARRTQQTAETLNIDGFTTFDALYNADLAALMATIRGLDEACDSALLVAHNPGISWLAASLMQPQACPGLSPGSFLQLRFSGRWAELRAGQASLQRRLDPPAYTG